MSKKWDDYEVLYKETDEDASIRVEQEATAKNRGDVFGAHRSPPSGKVRGAFKSSTTIRVPRVKKSKVNTSSKVWQDYINKKITFAEMKAKLGL